MNKGKQLETLVHFATGIGCHVSLVPLQCNDGRVKGKRIGIRATMSIDEYVHNIAHELAHIYLQATCSHFGHKSKYHSSVQIDFL